MRGRDSGVGLAAGFVSARTDTMDCWRYSSLGAFARSSLTKVGRPPWPECFCPLKVGQVGKLADLYPKKLGQVFFELFRNAAATMRRAGVPPHVTRRCLQNTSMHSLPMATFCELCANRGSRHLCKTPFRATAAVFLHCVSYTESSRVPSNYFHLRASL